MRIGWLDLKLAVRMLVKYPSLTVIGGLGMAVAIAVSAVAYVFSYSYLYPTLPLHEGERIVGIVNWDAAANREEPRSLHDFVAWRQDLASFEDVGAYRPIQRNLIAPGHAPQALAGAEITAAGLRLARVPPIAGRLLVEDDERRGSADVVVIGFDVWRTEFSSDPGVVGRSVRLGTATHTVIGVMPEGFAFPVNQRLWVPMRADPAEYERRQGPAIEVFGRLAQDATETTAQAELTAAGLRTAAAFPQTHAQLRPRLVPYTALWFNEAELWQVHLLQVLVTSLLIVVCANVASLVYARTAARHVELAVRSALGAGRRRIAGQLFVEALVLAAVAAAFGLLIADAALRYAGAFLHRAGAAPFWVQFGLSWKLVLYVAGLTALGAVVIGVVPALQATGRQLQSGLREIGGATGIRLGRTWTALIVAQVAFAVAMLPTMLFTGSQLIRNGLAGPGFAAEQFLTARVAIDEDAAGRYATRVEELVQQVKAEQAVSAVTFAAGLPGDETTVWVEVEGITAPAAAGSNYAVEQGSDAGHEVRTGRVDPGFFTTFQVQLLAGRMFEPGDRQPGAEAVVVNRSFARDVLGSGNPLGRRLRYVGASGDAPTDLPMERWFQIVGVVGDFPAHAIEPQQAAAKVYHAVTPEQANPISLAVRFRDAVPAGFADRLRDRAAVLDPAIRLQRVLPLDVAYDERQNGMRMAALAILLVVGSILLLSAAGLYALMSFTVVQRRREIGIRVALGGKAFAILGSVFARALRQLATGIALGVLAAAALNALDPDLLAGRAVIVLPAVSCLMLLVGLAAAFEPLRRGLRVQPTEALRGD